MAFQEGLAPSLPFLSSAWQKLHSWETLPRIWGTLSPSSQSRAKVSPWEGQAANFSHFTYSSVLQNVIPGKYSQEVWSTFTHLARSYNIEAVTQARQAKSTGTLITFILVSSQSEGSTQGKNKPERPEASISIGFPSCGVILRESGLTPLQSSGVAICQGSEAVHINKVESTANNIKTNW